LPAIVALLSLALCVAVDLGLEARAATEPPGFDHARTRFPLTGAHGRVSCESCHVSGEMASTPRTCVACHGGAGSRALTGRPANLPHLDGVDPRALRSLAGHRRVQHVSQRLARHRQARESRADHRGVQ